MIGRSNARRGARRIFAVLQNKRLNQHIVYTVLDEVSSSTIRYIHRTDSCLTDFRHPVPGSSWDADTLMTIVHG